MKRSFHLHVISVASVVLASCGYTAPDYGACDPDRPSEFVTLETFDRTLEGMDASVQSIVSAVEGEHTAALSAEGDVDPIEVILSFSFEPEAEFIPASEGCDVDRLEVTVATRVSVPSGESAEGKWSFSLSPDTAQETFGGFDEAQAALMLEALGVEVDKGVQLDNGFGTRFVSRDDLSEAAFEGSGAVSTLGGPNTESVALARFSWGE